MRNRTISPPPENCPSDNCTQTNARGQLPPRTITPGQFPLRIITAQTIDRQTITLPTIVSAPDNCTRKISS